MSEPLTMLPAGGTNEIGHLLGLLGDEWTLLLMQQALLGRSRYGEFLDALPISTAVLTARLRRLENEGLLTREATSASSRRAEYRLTQRGASLWTMLLSIWNWERTWVPDRAQELARMVHALPDCGREFAPVVACAACDEPAAPRSVSVRWGPSGTWERSMPSTSTRRRGDVDRPDAGLFPDTSAIIGNRWSATLIGGAYFGLTRFGEFERALGAPPALVAQRLRSFVDFGVLDVDDTVYRLTAKGRAFYPVMVTALGWGLRWYRAAEGPALVLTHRGCGAGFTPVLGCDQCGRRLRGREVAEG